jgi:hypothetical protein
VHGGWSHRGVFRLPNGRVLRPPPLHLGRLGSRASRAVPVPVPTKSGEYRAKVLLLASCNQEASIKAGEPAHSRRSPTLLALRRHRTGACDRTRAGRLSRQRALRIFCCAAKPTQHGGGGSDAAPRQLWNAPCAPASPPPSCGTRAERRGSTCRTASAMAPRIFWCVHGSNADASHPHRSRAVQSR